MRPIGKGNAREFWSSVRGVPLMAGEQRHRLHFRMQEPYIYDPSAAGGVPLHGDHYSGVSEAEVMQEFPGVLDRLLADPSRLSLKQILALIGEKIGDRNSGLKKLAADRMKIGKSTDRMLAFVGASYEDDLTEMASGWEGGLVSLFTFEIGRTQWLTARLERAKQYWATIAFEAVFLSGLVALFWLPLLWKRARPCLPVIWGSLPVVFLLPYFLGYCRMAVAWPDPYFWGGPLYPWLLRMYRPLAEHAWAWDVSLVRWVPHVLEPLNQPSMVEAERQTEAEFGVFGIGPTIPAVMGLAIGLLAFGARRLAYQIIMHKRGA
jgi:hypothetical protein